MSEILRLKICPDTLPVMTLALGLATAEAITKTAGIACDLRWPNDVLVNGKKCAGILAQLEATALLAGIGVNVNHTSFPGELSAVATSIKMATGREHSREVLLDNLLSCIDSFTETLLREGKDPILRAFTHASSYVQGRRVLVDQGAAAMTGVTEGLDPQGFLILRDNSGKRTLVLAGGVRPCS
jgi:BirA family biotin operon repressor/biotin-[acetyl-CoA-carboxylase] ligase